MAQVARTPGSDVAEISAMAGVTKMVETAVAAGRRQPQSVQASEQQTTRSAGASPSYRAAGLQRKRAEGGCDWTALEQPEGSDAQGEEAGGGRVGDGGRVESGGY